MKQLFQRPCSEIRGSEGLIIAILNKMMNTTIRELKHNMENDSRQRCHYPNFYKRLSVQIIVGCVVCEPCVARGSPLRRGLPIAFREFEVVSEPTRLLQVLKDLGQ